MHNFLARLLLVAITAACALALAVPVANACVQRDELYGDDLIALLAEEPTAVVQVVQYETMDAVAASNDSTAGVVVAVTGYWGEPAASEVVRRGPLSLEDEIGCSNSIPYEKEIGDLSYWIKLEGGVQLPLKGMSDSEAFVSLDEAFGPINPVEVSADELAVARDSLAEASSSTRVWLIVGAVAACAALALLVRRNKTRTNVET